MNTVKICGYLVNEKVFIKAVKKSKNISQVIKSCGIKKIGGHSYKDAKTAIAELKLDTSHFSKSIRTTKKVIKTKVEIPKKTLWQTIVRVLSR